MSGKSITGTSDMLMYYQEQTYRLSCIFLHAINEATLVIDTHNVQFKFKEQNSSEGLEPLKNHIGDIVQTDLRSCQYILFVSPLYIDLIFYSVSLPIFIAFEMGSSSALTL